MLVAIGSDDAFHLGVLSSRIHALGRSGPAVGSGVGNDPRYSKSRCFDPFPFPDPDPESRADIARLAEAIDTHRKERQSEHPGLTLTQMYNVLGRLGHAELTPQEERIRDEGLLLILKELHDELDAAVAQSYGWPSDLSDEDIVGSLVALNGQRAREEARGVVRWIRPDYQIPRFGTSRERAEQVEAELVSVAAKASKPAFPTDPVGQTAAIMAALYAAERPVSAAEIAQGFRQGRKVENKVRRNTRRHRPHGLHRRPRLRHPLRPPPRRLTPGTLQCQAPVSAADGSRCPSGRMRDAFTYANIIAQSVCGVILPVLVASIPIILLQSYQVASGGSGMALPVPRTCWSKSMMEPVIMPDSSLER
jgi:hypothetical protein